MTHQQSEPVMEYGTFDHEDGIESLAKAMQGKDVVSVIMHDRYQYTVVFKVIRAQCAEEVRAEELISEISELFERGGNYPPAALELIHEYTQAIRQEARSEAWMPIETCPKDHSLFLATDGEYVFMMSWDGEALSPTFTLVDGDPCNLYRGGGTIIKWQPLPPPPALKEAKNV